MRTPTQMKRKNGSSNEKTKKSWCEKRCSRTRPETKSFWSLGLYVSNNKNKWKIYNYNNKTKISKAVKEGPNPKRIDHNPNPRGRSPLRTKSTVVKETKERGTGIHLSRKKTKLRLKMNSRTHPKRGERSERSLKSARRTKMMLRRINKGRGGKNEAQVEWRLRSRWDPMMTLKGLMGRILGRNILRPIRRED